ncbi:hypothetical protein BJV82DRAFT_629037 [Fennellomyces sp. T-0311]|nr:hypothetical protein BJV82DRAFT_629037 [Fennellomyces sp. T-0311]
MPGDSSLKPLNQGKSALKPTPSLSRLSSTEENIPQRPHLAYLRSAWSSRDLKPTKSLDSSGIKPIQLPALTIQHDLFKNELQRLALASKILFLVAVATDYWVNGIMLPLLVLGWVSLLVFDTEPSIVQYMAILTTPYLSLVLYWGGDPLEVAAFVLAVAGLVLSIVVTRFHHVVKKQHAQYVDERKQSQTFVNQAVEALANQRLLFLSTVAQEVQDAALMVITTLEQFSPSSILTDTHELLSACSIAVPIASISAINTTIKQVCYVSSHLELLGKLMREPPNDTFQSDYRVEFDVGDLVQNVGDALAGMAARLDVNLVVYHSENGMHYTNVLGDEGAIRHGLLNLLRNILEGCTPGACIELGLNIGSTEAQGKLLVTFEITHSISPAIPQGISPAMLPNANLTVQLLQFIGGKLQVSDAGKSRTRYEVTVEMELGSDGSRRLHLLEDTSMMLNKQLASVKFSNEPTLKDLSKFIESLKGLKMVLHARERSVFAKHLTSCLAGWNADISHVPVVRQAPTDDESEDSSLAPTPVEASTPESSSSAASSCRKQVPSPAIAEEQIHSIPPAFVLIDDDVETLERKIKEFRSQPPVSANTLQHHQHMRRHKHTKSSAASPQPNFFHQGTTAIIHFTSLNNFKRVRDTLQWFSTYSTSPFSMPRLVVVPKPAGPRRFLTAPLPQASLASVIQQRESHTPPTPGSAYIGTPGSHEPDKHRGSPVTTEATTPGRRRPGSGVYSPPQAATAESEGSNYFSMVGNGATRRRSHTDLQQEEIKREESPPVSTPPSSSTPDTNGDAQTQAPPAVTSSPIDAKPQSPASATPNEPDKKPATTIKKMSNFKLNKKKKASAFANVVSPPINVLIVEDNMINQAILSTWMKKHKIKCSVASNGQEAVERWKGGGFHLVLMDIQLPVMDGIEATKTIRAIEKEQKIGVLPTSTPTPSGSTTTETELAAVAAAVTQEEPPPSTFRSPVIIVALTASSLESDRHAALAAGCNDFLTKPVSLEWLEKKIIEWGCMQALIDFEGWRRWKRSATDKPALKGTPQREATAPSTTAVVDEEEAEEEKASVRNKGIMLPGAAGLSKRRFSTLDDKTSSRGTKNILLMAKSGSDSDLLVGRPQGDKDRRRRDGNK